MSPKPEPPRYLLAILTMLLAFPIFSTDIYLPSLDSIAAEFQTTHQWVQMTLAGYFIMFGVTQLFYGVLSDHYGRRRVMMVCMSLYTFASIVCAASTSVQMLLVGRCLQALGAGCAILTYAIARDVYTGKVAARNMSIMSAVVATATIVALVIGGVVQTYLSWRWNFVILAILGILSVAITAFFLPETNEGKTQHKIPYHRLLTDYRYLFFDRHYLGNALSTALVFGCLFAYVTGSPPLLMATIGLTPLQYSWVIMISVIGFIAGGFCNAYFAKHMDLSWVRLFGMISLFLGGFALLAGGYVSPHNVLWFLLAAIACEFGISVTISSGIAKALETIPERAGAGSAMIGFMRFGFAGISSVIVTLFHYESAVPMAWIILGFALLSWSVLSIQRGSRPASG